MRNLNARLKGKGIVFHVVSWYAFQEAGCEE